MLTLIAWSFLIVSVFEISCIGKVHGSLARAGKVKGQTPKVFLHYIICTYIRYILSLTICNLMFILGRETGEEEEEDWPGKTSNAIQQTFCQCCSDFWQEEGTQLQCSISSCMYVIINTMG